MRSGLLRLLRAVAVVALACLPLVAASPDLYCGAKNCYDILSLPGTATKGEIKKSFYKLSLQYHPDKNSSPDAVELFREVTTAYEVLSDAESRASYDEALQHPERFFQNQYRYYQHRYKHANKIDAWKILVVTLVAVTLAHYYYWLHRYKKLRIMIASAPLVQTRMRAKVKADILEQKSKAGQKNPTASKDEIEAGVLKEDVSAYAELASWEGRPPTIWDTLPVWLAKLPWRFCKFVYWHGRFILLFSILGHPYGPEEAEYATSQALGMEYTKFLRVPPEQRAELSKRALWVPKNLESWRREMMNSKKKTW